jgi:hypothetical protein
MATAAATAAPDTSHTGSHFLRGFPAIPCSIPSQSPSGSGAE